MGAACSVNAIEGKGYPLMDSKRKTPRIKCDAVVDYTLRSEVGLDHRFENLGLGGACLQTAQVQDVGSEVILMISFPDMGEEAVEVAGTVVWANPVPPCDMGVRFNELSAETRETLKRYINARVEPASSD